MTKEADDQDAAVRKSFPCEMPWLMPQTLIVQADRRRCRGVLAEPGGDGVRIQPAFTCEWPGDFDPLQAPAQTAGLLQPPWTAAGTPPARTVLVLSREDVILRHLEVPEVPESELPDLVRFQAAARSTLPLDQLLLDYLPLPKLPGQTGRAVLAVTAPQTLAQGWITVLQQAGCEVSQVTCSSFGLAELVCQLEQLQRQFRHVLAVWSDGPRVELVITAGRDVLYAHSARCAADDGITPAWLTAEVSRTIVAAQRLHPTLHLQHVWHFCVTQDADQWSGPLSAQLGVPVEFLMTDRLPRVTRAPESSGNRGSASPVQIGCALAEVQRLAPEFDFLHPRKPPAKQHRWKLPVAVGAAAVLLLAFLVFGTVARSHASLQRELAALADEEQALDLKIRPGQASLQAARLIDDWLAADVKPLEQFTALRELMEGTDRMYLSQTVFTAGQGEIRGSLHSFGNAKSAEDVAQFYQRLIDTKGYRIQPKQLTQTGRDDEYPHRFELQAEMLMLKKKSQ